VSEHHQDMVSFGARQFLDMFSPSNLPATNPEIQIPVLRSMQAGSGNGIDHVTLDDLDDATPGAGEVVVVLKVRRDCPVDRGFRVARRLTCQRLLFGVDERPTLIALAVGNRASRV